MGPLAGKVALITGGSSGIGLAAALRLAARGARLVLAARTPAALDEAAARLRERGADVLTVPTDVADSDQCGRAVARAVEHFGRLDILLCSAGVSLRAAFADCSLAVAEQVLRVNFFGTLYATHHALPHVRRSRGSLVAVSSLTGRRGVPSYSIYGASKFAVQGLYDSLRLEVAADGVHVGVLSPGFVDTPLRERVLGPTGEPYPEPPAPPFRVWPLDRCADLLVRLIERRRREALLPWFIRPLLAFDVVSGGGLGDHWLRGHFRHHGGATGTPPEGV